MRSSASKFCRIICFEKGDFDSLDHEFGAYEIDLLLYEDKNQKIEDVDVPTLVLGWNFIKANFPKQRISQKKIRNNLNWTFSGIEDKGQMETDLKHFLSKSFKDFLPSNYKAYDKIINEEACNLLRESARDSRVFCYFGNNDSFYVYNSTSGVHVGINLETIDYVGESKNDFLIGFARDFCPIFLSYENIPECIRHAGFTILTLENIAWACQSRLISETSLHKYSPFPTRERDLVFFMSKLFDAVDCGYALQQDVQGRYLKKDQITEWLSSQVLHFSDGKDLVLRYSNKKTITGRINCSDKRFNPQLLPKKSEERKNIVSIFERGKIAVFDFVSFETKISVYLTKDKEFIEKVSRKDIHEITGQILFGDRVNPKSRELGKKINHSIIYGIGKEKLNDIFLENNIPASKAHEVKKFLEPIMKSSRKISEEYKKNGYIINPYKSIVHPQKEWAAYNNYIQSTAADMVVDKLFQVKEALKGRHSRFMYQVYDSFVLDIHPDELFIVDIIKKKLESNGIYYFETEHVIGNSLWECTNFQNIEENASLL